MLMTAENVAAALDFRHHIRRGIAHVPAGAGDHPGQHRPEVYGQRQRIQRTDRLHLRIIQQQIQHLIGITAVGLPLEFAFDQRIFTVCKAVEHQFRSAPVGGIGNTVAIAEHVAVGGAHVEPVEGNIIDIIIKHRLAQHLPEKQCGPQVAGKTEGAVTHPLIVPGRLILKFPHGHQLLQNFVGAILVRYRVFIINSNTHGKQIAGDLQFIAVTVDNALAERRPRTFHIPGQTQQISPEQIPFFRRGQVIAPVIHAGGGVDGPADFPGDVQQVAEFHQFHVTQCQPDGFSADGFVAGHQVIKRLVDHGIFHLDIKLQFLIRIGLESHGRQGVFADSIPERLVFRMVQAAADEGEILCIHPDPGMALRGDERGFVILYFRRNGEGGVERKVYRFQGTMFRQPDLQILRFAAEVEITQCLIAAFGTAPRDEDVAFRRTGIVDLKLCRHGFKFAFGLEHQIRTCRIHAGDGLDAVQPRAGRFDPEDQIRFSIFFADGRFAGGLDHHTGRSDFHIVFIQLGLSRLQIPPAQRRLNGKRRGTDIHFAVPDGHCTGGGPVGVNVAAYCFGPGGSLCGDFVTLKLLIFHCHPDRMTCIGSNKSKLEHKGFVGLLPRRQCRHDRGIPVFTGLGRKFPVDPDFAEGIVFHDYGGTLLDDLIFDHTAAALFHPPVGQPLQRDIGFGIGFRQIIGQYCRRQKASP